MQKEAKIDALFSRYTLLSIDIDTPTKYDIGHSKTAFYAKVIK